MTVVASQHTTRVPYAFPLLLVVTRDTVLTVCARRDADSSYLWLRAFRDRPNELCFLQRSCHHAGVQLFPMTAVCFRMLQFHMFRMLGVIEHTALYGQNPDTRYAYVCAVYIRNRINTDGPALHISYTQA